jgi:hypothetical protein
MSEGVILGEAGSVACIQGELQLAAPKARGKRKGKHG